jgi:hypothetical protein
MWKALISTDVVSRSLMAHHIAPGHKMHWKRDRLLWRLAGISAGGQPSRETSPISSWKVAWGEPHQQEKNRNGILIFGSCQV